MLKTFQWELDPIRPGDKELFENSTKDVFTVSCFEKGMVCVLKSKAAQYFES